MVFVPRRSFTALAPAAIAERRAMFAQRAVLQQDAAMVATATDPFIRRRAQQQQAADLQRARR